MRDGLYVRVGIALLKLLELRIRTPRLGNEKSCDGNGHVILVLLIWKRYIAVMFDTVVGITPVIGLLASIRYTTLFRFHRLDGNDVILLLFINIYTSSVKLPNDAGIGPLRLLPQLPLHRY